MSRLDYLKHHPKKAAGALGTLMVAATLTAGSGAFFQDEAASAGNSVQGGTVDVVMAGSEQPTVDGNACDTLGKALAAACNTNRLAPAVGGPATTLTVANLTPGNPVVSRTVAACNQGTVPAYVRLSLDRTGGDEALFDAMDVAIGRLAGFFTAPPQDFVLQNAGVQAVAATASGLGGMTKPAQVQGVIADKPLIGARKPLEPGRCFGYQVGVKLDDDGSDQQALMGKTVEFAVRATARSVNSAGR